MKVFTSAIENMSINIDGKRIYFAEYCLQQGVNLKWNLLSYYYLRNHKDNAVFLRNNSDEILIDSGAHSFQFGKKVNWVEYTKEYAEWIKTYDAPNVVGYFEMDIENIIGYDKVKELRKILENASDKIIPVWHPDRGIDDYEEMCCEYHDKVIAIGGFRGTDIKDEQFLSFVKVARKYNCKVHCLGMTRQSVLDKVPFHYTDSATWLTAANMGNAFVDGIRQTKKYKFPKAKGIKKWEQYLHNYKQMQLFQNKYYNKWRKECKD